MAIITLNCASMSPWFPRWRVGTTCLLVETDQGLVLIDTGLGLHDHLAPTRLVRLQFFNFGIHSAPEETAARRLLYMGIHPEDVQHIVLTHLHFDHAGGLPDFPWAAIHLHQREHAALLHPRTWLERWAYDQADFAHKPKWVLYAESGEKWFDFEAIRLPFNPEMYLIPLFGHTSGHCGVAIRRKEGDWLFQCGDALPLDADFAVTPAYLNRLILGPHIPRIQVFAAAHPEVRLLAGHRKLLNIKE